MIRKIFLCGLIIVATGGAGALEAYTGGNTLATQKRQNQKLKAAICGNPKEPCRTTFQFKPYDLPFRVSEKAIIYDTEPFYAIILKSVRVVDNNCSAFVPEAERLKAQALFPDHKVFTSRCPEPAEVYYTNVSPDQNFMAVYAGRTRAEATRRLAAVKATGQYPGANIRRLRAGINGT
jgi:hypothetical protein